MQFGLGAPPVLLFLVVGLLCWRMKFGFAAVLIVQMVPQVVGISELTGSDSGGAASGLLLATFALWLGHILGDLRSRRTGGHPDGSERINALPDSFVWGAVIGAGALGLYHLLMAGIPIFSEALERERFSFTSSGLWGIPGRMYLYGIPIAWLLALANGHVKGGRLLSYRPFAVGTAFLATTTVLGGFKGDVLSLAFFVLASLGAFRAAGWTVGRVVVRYCWAFALGVLYFGLTVVLYPSYEMRGGSVFSQLYDRLTVIAAEPIVVALSGLSPQFAGDIPSDFRYYFVKYLGGDTTGLFSFERFVSAQMIGADPTSDAWTTPVTIGGYAELVHSGGFWLGILGMLVAGFWLASLDRATSARPIRKAMALSASWGLFLWIAKGGLAYYVINFAAVALIVGLLGAAFTFFTGELDQRPRCRHRAPIRPVRPYVHMTAAERRPL